MAIAIQAAKSTFATILWLVTLMGLALIGGGIWLVYLGATGGTELSLFGNEFKSQNVGAVGIFCGAVLVGAVMRRTLRTVERIVEHGDSAPPN
jgi:hypothetical protein